MFDKFGKSVKLGDWVETWSIVPSVLIVYGKITKIYHGKYSYVDIHIDNYPTQPIRRHSSEIKKLSENEIFLRKMEASYDR